MRRNPVKQSLTFVAVCLFSWTAWAQAQVTSSSTIYYSVVDTMVAPRDSFWVDIKVSDVTNLFGVSFTMRFDQDTLVRVVSSDSILAGDFLGGDILFTKKDSLGHVSLGLTRKDGAGGVNGSGTLARVKLYLKQNIEVFSHINLTFQDLQATDPTGANVTLNTSSLRLTVSGIAVWPGDADNSGYVDQTDVLPLGINWHATGPARASASRSWIKQYCAPWLPTAVTYVDCDGSGKVDQADILPIGLNWHKSHGTLLASVPSFSTAATARYADALAWSAEADPSEAGVYLLTLRLTPAYAARFLGVSMSVAALAGGEIISAAKGGAFSSQALFLALKDNGLWGVGITETATGLAAGEKGFELLQIRFRTAEEESDPLSLLQFSNVCLSLDGEGIVSLGDPFEALAVTETQGPALPKSFDLAQNSPNPFNPSTSIAYSVPEGQAVQVSLQVFDLRGRLVRSLVEARVEPGSYVVMWDGTDRDGRAVGSGVYFYRLRTDGFVRTRKMVLLK
jgi:hypothetical protein